MGKKISEQNWEMRNNEDVTYLRMDVPTVFVDADEPNKNVVITGEGMHGVLVGKTPIYFHSQRRRVGSRDHACQIHCHRASQNHRRTIVPDYVEPTP
jgi:hypothetical protein